MAAIAQPKFRELDNLGLKNEEQVKTAKVVYTNLCDVKHWWNVQLHSCHDLDLVFISGHATRHTPRELVLPVPRGQSLTPGDLQVYLNALQLEDYCTDGITLAVMDTDSTTVYYKISNGLVPPPSPEFTESKRHENTAVMQKRKNDVLDNIDKYMEKKSRQEVKSESRTEEPQDVKIRQLTNIQEVDTCQSVVKCRENDDPNEDG